MDRIEDADIDVDIDGSEPPQTVATLILIGDFMESTYKYYHDEDASQIELGLPRDVAIVLHHKLTEVLYG